jgi:Family of unknown function (DUF6455)
MPIGKPHSNGKPTTPEQQEELLGCRMAMLGLQLDPAETADAAALHEMMRRCMECGYREACAVDLERDPNNPVWETYCPNAGALIELAQDRWLNI